MFSRNDTSLSRLLEAISKPALMVNASGVIRCANRAGWVYLGLFPQHMQGDGPDDIFSWPTDEWQQRITEALATHRPQSWEFSGGGPLPRLKVELIPWPTEPEQPPWVVMILEDLAASDGVDEAPRQVSHSAAGLNQFRSRFISMASHEFRTPLSVIYSSAELLEHFGAQWPIEKQHKHLKRIQAHVRNMINLLDDAVMLDRIDSGSITPHPGPIDLAQVCRRIADEFQRGEGAEHEVVVNQQGASHGVMADEPLLRYILFNLLSNAAKYSPAAKAIRFDLTCQADQITLLVHDEGMGIPADEISQVFERFYRASNVGSLPGTGLGLPIVKYLVDLQGGTIQLESQINAGTTVTVKLPMEAH